MNDYNFVRLLYETDQQADKSHNLWMCRCLRCKRNFLVRKGNVIAGFTKSCGCLRESRSGTKTTYNSVRLLRRTGLRADKSHYYWLCRCLRCDAIFLSVKHAVVSGRTKSCGCLRKDRAKRRTNFRDYAGQTVGYILIHNEIGVTSSGLLIWEGTCVYEGCGNRVTVSSELLRGKTTSCGCRARKETRRRALAKYKELDNARTN